MKDDKRYNRVVWTEAKKAKAIAMLTDYYEQHGWGECIQQSDEAIIEAPNLLADIADKVLIYGKGIVSLDEGEDK